MKKYWLHFSILFAVLIAAGAVVLITLSNPESSQVTLSSHPKPKTDTPTKGSKTLSFTIGGDVMTGRAVAWKFHNDVTQAFENLGQGVFSNQTLDIVNLEGPISSTDFQANPTPDNLIFNFPPQTIDALKYLGVNAVSQANNHSFNQGKAGFEETKKLLEDAKITPIGSQTEYDISRFGSGAKKLSIITINLLEDHSDFTGIIADEKKAGNIVLVFPHWGSEYEETHNQSQANAAHSWIDAGADIIIGSHPHVVQDAEIYNSKPIIYSLGNLIFDQTFSTPTQEGLIVKGSIVDKNLTLEFLPTKIKNYQVQLKDGEEKSQAIQKLLENIPAKYLKDNKIVLNL